MEASGPGPDVTRSYGELSLGRGYMHDLDELFRRDGLELVGNWHVHRPVTTRAGRKQR